jgi:hypothetical protein
MRARTREESIESRGSTSWNDWFDPIDGTSSGNGSITTSQDPGTGTGGAGGDGKNAVGKTAGLDALTISTKDYPGLGAMKECVDGVCPVPWAVKEETPAIKPDQVNHPPHYTDGGIECIEAIESQLTSEEYRGYLKGNIAKYMWRERMKGGTESLKKAQWYLDRLIQSDEAQNG